VFHAWPPEAEVRPGEWASPFRAQRDEVEEAIGDLHKLGFTYERDMWSSSRASPSMRFSEREFSIAGCADHAFWRAT
jgi:hypothetical protein